MKQFYDLLKINKKKRKLEQMLIALFSHVERKTTAASNDSGLPGPIIQK